MADTPIVELIDPDLEELMDRFFANSRKDIVKMRAAYDAGDFKTLARLGHTAKGTGYGYGFSGMGDIGLQLEMAAKEERQAECEEQIEKMVQYIENVRVEFGD